MTALIATAYTLYRPGLVPTFGHVQLPVEPGYAALKAAVEPMLEGGRMEHVTVLYEGRRADMFVDEIGIQKGLRRNEHATSIYRAASLRADPRLMPEQLACIYGPAVLFTGRQVWF